MDRVRPLATTGRAGPRRPAGRGVRYRARYGARYGAAVVAAGLSTGLLALALVLLLRGVEYVVFGAPGVLDGPLPGGVAPGRPGGDRWRMVAVTAGGVCAALLWWWLGRTGEPTRVDEAIAGAAAGKRPAVGRTAANAAIQMVAVGSGASIGREAAPRETGAVGASLVASLFRLTPAHSRIIVGSSAAAGLAAVYHVPVAGVFFALEILLATRRPVAILTAVATTLVATTVTLPILGGESVYPVPALPVAPVTLGWALLAGILLGPGGRLFGELAGRAGRDRARGARILVALPVVSVVVGFVAIRRPEILGNGMLAAHEALEGGAAAAGIGVVVLIAVAKAAATLATLRAGAVGGTLTPALAVGALLGAAGAMLLRDAGGDVAVTTGALLGAAAFLAASLRAPLTAAALVIEFTGLGVAALPAVLVAVGTGAVAGHVTSGWYRRVVRGPSR